MAEHRRRSSVFFSVWLVLVQHNFSKARDGALLNSITKCFLSTGTNLNIYFITGTKSEEEKKSLTASYKSKFRYFLNCDCNFHVNYVLVPARRRKNSLQNCLCVSYIEQSTNGQSHQVRLPSTFIHKLSTLFSSSRDS